jgi:CCR4-NOT transcription complex subunit 4
LLKGINGQHGGLLDQLPTSTGVSGFEHNPLSRAAAFPTHTVPMGPMQGHARQSSRFSFANDSNPKNPANQRMMGQQTSMMQTSSPNPLATPTTRHGLGDQFFASGVQGPPPGLRSAGTPPVSGGGMFAQGHGFTTAMNSNLGHGAKQDSNADLMREFMRSGRGGAGGVQAHEAQKREFLSPFLQQHNTPPPLAPVSGLLGPLYGQQTGPHQDPGPLKQKKRGKKHRHANTSSGGGGVVDPADPSILQARMHQAGASAGQQGLYGSQGQGGYNQASMMYGAGFGRW